MEISYKRLGLVVLITLLGVLALLYITPLMMPFIIGWIIALILNPFVRWCERKLRIPRWAAVSIALFLFISIFLGLLVAVIAQVSIELIELGSFVPQYVVQLTSYIETFLPSEQLQYFLSQFQGWYGSLNPEYKTKIEQNIGSWLNVLGSASIKLIEGFFNGLTAFLSSLPNMATLLMISILSSFFIAKDYYKIQKRILQWIPIQIQISLGKVLRDLNKALFGFIKAQLTLISITALIVTIGLFILRVEYAITIGIITGLVDLLPYLGTGAIFVPWILYLFFTKQYSLVIGLSILYGLIVVVRQILEPKILAENVGLDPLLSLIALFVGLKLFGFAGIIIGPISLVLIQAMYKAHVFADIWEYIKKKPVV